MHSGYLMTSGFCAVTIMATVQKYIWSTLWETGFIFVYSQWLQLKALSPLGIHKKDMKVTTGIHYGIKKFNFKLLEYYILPSEVLHY